MYIHERWHITRKGVIWPHLFKIHITTLNLATFGGVKSPSFSPNEYRDVSQRQSLTMVEIVDNKV